MWSIEHIRYLQELQKTADHLSSEYTKLYMAMQGKLYKIKLPSIILSSIAGFASFGSGNFGDENSNHVSIAVGITSLVVGILNSTESFFGIQTTATTAKASALVLALLSQRISLELCLPEGDRCAEGLNFTRTVAAEFLNVLEKAPNIQYKTEAQDRVRQMSKSLSESVFHSTEGTPSPVSARVIHLV